MPSMEKNHTYLCRHETCFSTIPDEATTFSTSHSSESAAAGYGALVRYERNFCPACKSKRVALSFDGAGKDPSRDPADSIQDYPGAKAKWPAQRSDIAKYAEDPSQAARHPNANRGACIVDSTLYEATGQVSEICYAGQLAFSPSSDSAALADTIIARCEISEEICDAPPQKALPSSDTLMANQTIAQDAAAYHQLRARDLPLRRPSAHVQRQIQQQATRQSQHLTFGAQENDVIRASSTSPRRAHFDQAGGFVPRKPLPASVPPTPLTRGKPLPKTKAAADRQGRCKKVKLRLRRAMLDLRFRCKVLTLRLQGRETKGCE